MFSSNASQVSSDANYIESCFSTYLYTGTSSAQTITNGIDLSTKGGLVWIKGRDTTNQGHVLADSARGFSNYLQTQRTDGQGSIAPSGITPLTTGFTMGGNSYSSYGLVNYTPYNFVSWTFRKQAKFFDVVTYTGDGTNGRAISHSLASTPGFIIVKSTSDAAQWVCWSRGFNSGNGYGYLNDTTAWFTSGEDVWGNGTSYIAPTSTTFTVKGGSLSNLSGRAYVAYLFAHNAGGFGLTGTDNVISCGSYTGNGSATGPIVTLGYEPQWILVKRASGGTGNWNLIDSMRGFINSTTATPSDAYLVPNTSGAEQTWGSFTGVDNAAIPLATGFQIVTNYSSLNNSGDTYIYIAIRRGPMAVPTDGTSVFSPNNFTPPTSTNTITTNFPVDLAMFMDRSGGAGFGDIFVDRLRGTSSTSAAYLVSTSAGSETLASGRGMNFANNLGYSEDFSYNYIGEQTSTIFWNMRRAPSFFDEVCYTGTGSATTQAHNLGAVPELMIIKDRSSATNWYVYNKDVGNQSALLLNATNTPSGASPVNWNSTTPTSTVFSIGTTGGVNTSGDNYVAYLFATCLGVSKVGSYTGTGATQTIACGFTGGARFVLIKRTDSTGSWYVWDTARGMVSGTDPSLLLNSTAAEVNANSIYTATGGFQIVSTAAGINASGGSYIYFSVA